MNIREQLRQLDSDARASADDDFKAMHSVEFHPVASAALAATEARLGHPLPPSYKRFVLENGTFTIGFHPMYSHMAFSLLEIGEIRTLHDQLAEDYEAETSEGISEEMGVDAEVIAAARHGIVFAMNGHEDYWVFDTRSRDPNTGEYKVVGVLLEDNELGYFAELDDYERNREFEGFIAERIAAKRSDDD